LLHLKKYKNCLEDIEFAIEYGYPKDMKYKMLERRGKCHLELRNTELAVASFQAAKDLVASTNLKEKTRKTLIETLDQQIAKCAETKPQETEEDDDESGLRKKIPEIAGDGRNAPHPNLSIKVRIENARNVGKHLVANEDIKVGDVLIVEKPFQSVVFTRFQKSHCYHCFKSVSVPIPCQQCTSVTYCSRDCRDQSWTAFHRYECSYFVLFDTSMCGKIGNLALRLFIIMGPAALIEYVKTHSELTAKEELGTAAETVAYSADYNGVYSLVTNTSERKLEDMFHLAVVSCYLMKLLQLTGYNLEAETGSADFDTLGGVLLRHLQIAQCNAWKITELQKPEKFDDLKQEEIGIGLYTTAAVVNHSCDPGADFNFFDDTLILRAIRNIAKDEEVAVSYGPVFYDVKPIPRQNQLRKAYLFNCK